MSDPETVPQTELERAVQTVRDARTLLEFVSPPVVQPLTKPGYQTSEFWLTAIHQVVALVATSGALPGFQDPTTKDMTLGGAVLSLVLYVYSRIKVKSR